METIRDMQGNLWQPFVNEYQQRQLKCIQGARLGDVVHDPRLDRGIGSGHTVSSRDPVRPALDPWRAGLDALPFWER